MATIKRVAHDVEYHIDIAGGTSFTEVACIKTIEDAGQTRTKVDMTCMSDSVMQNLAAPILEMGDIKLTLFWDEADATSQGLLEDAIEQTYTTVPNHKIVFNFPLGDVTKTFLGFVTEMGPVQYDVGSEVTRDVTISTSVIPTTT